MLIEEQIKIARLIASGTPREVAIKESSSAIEKSGQTIDVDAEEVKDTPQAKAKKRSEIAKAKQDALAITAALTVRKKMTDKFVQVQSAQSVVKAMQSSLASSGSRTCWDHRK